MTMQDDGLCYAIVIKSWMSIADELLVGVFAIEVHENSI